jgi:hypothetical protein
MNPVNEQFNALLMHCNMHCDASSCMPYIRIAPRKLRYTMRDKQNVRDAPDKTRAAICDKMPRPIGIMM